MHTELNQPTICVIGIGYVGLPLAQAFSQHFNVIGLDTNADLVNKVKEENKNPNLTVTTNPESVGEADFVIITVPTPVTRAKQPDLSHIISAARTISLHMKHGCTVVLESTVYPGVTEEVLKPILEQSGRQCGKDFRIAYSPERINPGDKEHTIDRITKVVCGMDDETTELVASLYGKVCPEVYKTRNIKTAEAAKVIENVQRDLNIALLNELSLIFERMGLITKEVLDAAATKWNFQRYSPGLVGGHCIPVDPYYLVHKATELGYHPRVILAGRSINDFMPSHVAQITVKMLVHAGKTIKGCKVLIMGLTYKENVADNRETPAKGIIEYLKEFDIEVFGYDPLINNIEQEFGIKAVGSFEELRDIDCVILTVPHYAFRHITLGDLRRVMTDNPVLVDVRGYFDQQDCEMQGFYYSSL